jgi:DNA-binding MarR family transcriptional regulator
VSGQPRARRRLTGSKQKLRLWLRLLRTSRSIEAELRRRFAAEFATTLPQFDVMAALSRAPNGMKMSELSRHLMVSNGNVTGIIERLVAEQSVERLVRAGDRRATFVCLTDKGLSRFAAMAEAHAGWIDTILGDLSSAEIETLSRLLARAPAAAAPANGGWRAPEKVARAQKGARFAAEARRVARRRSSGGSHVR